MAAAKACQVVKIAATPVTAIWGVVHGHALKQVTLAEGELAQKIGAHQAAGTDLAYTTTKDFIELQLRLFPYRATRLADEFAELNNGAIGERVKSMGAKDWIVFLRFVIRCVFMYMLGMMVCRQSTLPLIEPTSPLVPGIYEYHNPNKW